MKNIYKVVSRGLWSISVKDEDKKATQLMVKLRIEQYNKHKSIIQNYWLLLQNVVRHPPVSKE